MHDEPGLLESLSNPKPLIVAAVIGTGLAVLIALTGPRHDAEVNAAVAQEVHERACISQAAIYERMPKPVCASGTRDAPANALSYPLARNQ